MTLTVLASFLGKNQTTSSIKSVFSKYLSNSFHTGHFSSAKLHGTSYNSTGLQLGNLSHHPLHYVLDYMPQMVPHNKGQTNINLPDPPNIPSVKLYHHIQRYLGSSGITISQHCVHEVLQCLKTKWKTFLEVFNSRRSVQSTGEIQSTYRVHFIVLVFSIDVLDVRHNVSVQGLQRRGDREQNTEATLPKHQDGAQLIPSGNTTELQQEKEQKGVL